MQFKGRKTSAVFRSSLSHSKFIGYLKIIATRFAPLIAVVRCKKRPISRHPDLKESVMTPDRKPGAIPYREISPLFH